MKCPSDLHQTLLSRLLQVVFLDVQLFLENSNRYFGESAAVMLLCRPRRVQTFSLMIVVTWIQTEPKRIKKKNRSSKSELKKKRIFLINLYFCVVAIEIFLLKRNIVLCKSCFTLAWKCRDCQLSCWWWIQERRLRSSGAETPIDLRRSLDGLQWLGCGTVEGNGDTPSISIYVRASMTDDLLSKRVSPVTLPAQLSIWILRLMVCLLAWHLW